MDLIFKDIHNFSAKFFQAELDARNAYIKPDVELALKKLDTFHSFSVEELHDKFGITKNGIPDEDLYEDMEGVSYKQPRHLFKLSQYKNKKYGDLYLAFVSTFNPKPNVFMMFQCFFVANIDGKLKIINAPIFSEGEGETPYWTKGQGRLDATFDTVGELVKVERFVEPSDDPYSIKEYTKEI